LPLRGAPNVSVFQPCMSKAPVSEITELSDQAIEWIILLNSADATDTHRQQAAQWIKRSPSHRRAFVEAEQLLLDMGEAMMLKESRLNLQATRPKKPFYRHYRLRILAVASLVLALVLPISDITASWFSDYYTGVGEQKSITLADGSWVMLNTDTALSVTYSATGRRLILKRGEAVFHVAADRNRPFEVVTDTAMIKALGTVFAVATTGELTRVTVEEHAVSVKGRQEQTYAINAQIKAGQQAVYDSDHGLQAPVAVDSAQSAAWQRGKLIFKNQPLATVVAELDRYFPGRIVIIHEPLTNLRVSGVFPINDAVATLKMIEHTLPLRVSRLTPWLTLLHGQ